MDRAWNRPTKRCVPWPWTWPGAESWITWSRRFWKAGSRISRRPCMNSRAGKGSLGSWWYRIFSRWGCTYSATFPGWWMRPDARIRDWTLRLPRRWMAIPAWRKRWWTGRGHASQTNRDARTDHGCSAFRFRSRRGPARFRARAVRVIFGRDRRERDHAGVFLGFRPGGDQPIRVVPESRGGWSLFAASFRDAAGRDR